MLQTPNPTRRRSIDELLDTELIPKFSHLDLILNLEAEADRVESDSIVRQIMELTRTEPVKV